MAKPSPPSMAKPKGSVGAAIFPWIFVAAIVLSFLLIFPWHKPSVAKEGRWLCVRDVSGRKTCIQYAHPIRGGYTTQSACQKACGPPAPAPGPSPPPAPTYWACQTDPQGQPTGVCHVSKTKTPYTSEDQCMRNCVPPKKYFKCSLLKGTPVRTGKCEPATARDPGSFQCPEGVTQCDPTKCPEAKGCMTPQCWKCDSPGNCIEVDCSAQHDYETDPSDPASLQNYAKCQKGCKVYVHCDSPGSCAHETTAKPPSGWLALPSGQSVSQWCTKNCAAPPPAPGKAYMWDDTKGTCTLQQVPSQPPVPPNYKTLVECLKAQCKPHGRVYCDGASDCSPKSLPNPICCAGSYCDPTVCQQCINKQCMDRCAYDPTGKKIDSPCVSCLKGTGTCSNILCHAFARKTCSCPPGVDPEKDPSKCKCIDATKCAPGLVWDEGFDAMWWCPSTTFSGWCLDPKDTTQTWTSAQGSQANTPGVCPLPPSHAMFGADRQQCIKVTGPYPPPQGGAGCRLIGDGPASSAPAY